MGEAGDNEHTYSRSRNKQNLLGHYSLGTSRLEYNLLVKQKNALHFVTSSFHRTKLTAQKFQLVSISY